MNNCSTINIIKKDSSFLDLLFEKGEYKEGYFRYKILHNFGTGEVFMYPLFPGFYLSLNNFRLKEHIFNNTQHNLHSYNMLKMDYCLSGEYRFRGPDGMIGIVGEKDCGCYAGRDSYRKVEFKDGLCCSISLFCYMQEFKTTLKQMWGDSGVKLDQYYRKLMERDEYLITQNDPVSEQLVVEIRKFASKQDSVLLRLKAVELFFREINLFLENRKKSKRHYSGVHLEKVSRIKKTIDKHYYRNFTVQDLSEKEGINSSYLKMIFKDRYGDSIYSYKKTLRLKNAETLLRETDLRIYEIVHAVGYADAGKFTRAFRERYSLPPSEYRDLKRL